MDDVEIVGRDRRALDHAGGTADDDEFNSGVAQLREQRGKVSGLRMRRSLGSLRGSAPFEMLISAGPTAIAEARAR